MDFSWFYFIGRAKLKLSDKEIGHLTVTLFNKLYGHYKDNFDLELRLLHANKTYRELAVEAQRAERWL